MLSLRPLTRSGDTIVEVLIAVSILGLVLAGAYAIANVATHSVRDAQEHTAALKLAENQVEAMIDAKGTSYFVNTIFNEPKVFCMNDEIRETTYDPSTYPTLENDPLLKSKYKNFCTYRDDLYYVGNVKDAATCNDANSKTCNITVHVRWFSNTGNKNEVTLSYKLIKL